jgi:hypothetical protein
MGLTVRKGGHLFLHIRHRMPGAFPLFSDSRFEQAKVAAGRLTFDSLERHLGLWSWRLAGYDRVEKYL